MKLKIEGCYNNLIQKYHMFFNTQCERCVIEEYRNNLSKIFNIPSGHRWQFDEWYEILDYAMQLLVDNNYITEQSKNFYCYRIK